MTPEERQMLADFAKKFAQTPPPAREPEAEDFIRTQIGNRPDALYLMTQTVLVQNMALDHARQEIEQLKRQQPAAQPGGGSFLGGGGWGSPNTPPPAYNAPQGYGAPPPYTPAPPSPPPPGPGFSFGGLGGGGGMGSFLKTAGIAAAGVAGGALAFEGIKSMFGGVEHLMGYGGHQGGSGFLGDGGQPVVEETVVNNYYDRPDQSSPSEQRGSLADSLGPSDSVDYDNTDVPVDDTSSDDSV